MKCSVPGCKEMPYYIFIDGCPIRQPYTLDIVLLDSPTLLIDENWQRIIYV